MKFIFGDNTKTKILVTGIEVRSGAVLEDKINDFIKDKDVIDIKITLSPANSWQEGHSLAIALIMYNG